MSAAGAADAWADAALAAALLALDPEGLGGACLRARAGPARDRWLDAVRGLLPDGRPLRKLPLHAGDGRLLGGLDLAATLRAGRPVAERGVLAEADGGLVLLAMAERLPPATAARLAAVLDAGEVVVERDGLALRHPARVALVALDEGEADERPAAALLDRLALLVDLEPVGGARAAVDPGWSRAAVAAARGRLPGVTADDATLEALAATAAALGVDSARSVLLALRAARAAAALGGRERVADGDAAAAARLVLAPRALRLPPPPGEDVPPAAAEPPAGEPPEAERPQEPRPPPADLVLAAALAAIPAGLLARLKLAGGDLRRARTAGKAGSPRRAAARGRPVGSRRGELRAGARLNVVETLRAAAPWQPLRRADATVPHGRVQVRPDDFRVTRLKHKSRATTIFVVDASGSAAFQRLAEAKGAVELLLAQCYVRRDQVALLAFRGAGAELLLPPTRSLARAKRSLAGLPGGGGTPLAAGLDAALALADAARRRGETPVVVLLTDGRANVARDGAPGRARAERDALAAARGLRAAGLTALLVDTSPRPQPAARQLAAELGGPYLPLPYADAAALSRAVRAGAATAS